MSVDRKQRTPPSPLLNENKRSRMGALCFLCDRKISDTSSVVGCVACNNMFHPLCAFSSPSNEAFFEKNSIPWFCQPCYFKKISSTSSAVSELQQTVTGIVGDLQACMDKVSNMSNQVSLVHQELTYRMDNIESSVEINNTKLSNIFKAGVPNVIMLNGLRKQIFKDRDKLRSYLNELFKCMEVWCSGLFYDFYWKNDFVLALYFLDKSSVAAIYTKYNEILKVSSSGIVTSNFQNLNAIQSTITFTIQHSPNEDILQRIDKLEIQRLSQDIKVIGIQFLKDETSSKLKNYVFDIAKAIAVEVNLNSFTVRRVNETKMCIVSFRESSERDQLFYAYMNFVKNKKTAGVTNVTTVPTDGNIIFNDNLCESSKIIMRFCFALKYYYKQISAFSTRKGKIVIKIRAESDWKMVHSLDDLHNLLKQNQLGDPQ